MTRLRAFLPIFALPFFSQAVLAQSGTGVAISGTVADPSGAAIPGAHVSLTFVSSGAERKQDTGADGEFSLLQLSTGTYQVRVDAPGFAPGTQSVTYQGFPIRLIFALSAAASAQVQVNASDAVYVEEPQAVAHVNIPPEEMERMPTQSVSAPFSSLITNTTPGVAADSNGSFHPLGDHAEASFFLDGQPITDQQSRIFSTQPSLHALQSVQVREGAPAADVGDKTSMVIVAQTRSGLDQRKPGGTVSLSRGTFGTSTGAATIAFGTERFGAFTAADAVTSERFLDTPEAEVIHAHGNAENLIERLDFRATNKTNLQLNASVSRSWFQTPNTYDQQSLRQNQRQTIVSFNLAPQMIHTFSSRGFNQTNLWLRQDKVRYRPSENIFSDSPAYLAQARRLTDAGLRTEFTYTRGRHALTAGGQFKHTFLSESFYTGLTDPTYNAPCLSADGSPSANTAVRDPAQCAAAGLAPDPDFLSGLLHIDLTRGGSPYSFRGRTDIKQEALFAQDVVTFGSFQAKLGLRYDKFNGLTSSFGMQPRAGVTYGIAPLRTTLRADYSRIFITPYNENLIVASSNGPGSPASFLSANNSAVLRTGTRNQYNIGFTTVMRAISASGEYLWKYTQGAYDFDVLLNSPLTFPTQFRQSKQDGGLVRVTLAPTHGIAGFITVSHTRSRLFGPQTGGVSFSAPYSNVTRPDHDEGLAMNANLRYQFGKRGPWFNLSYRYDGGLVSVATPDLPTAFQLSGDEQAQMGLYCGATFATVASPIRSCNTKAGATRIRIPAAGTYDADKHPARIAVRNTVDLSAGEDDLFHHENHRFGIRVEVVNLSNVTALYNYLSTFSGTHFLTPRTVTLGIRYGF